MKQIGITGGIGSGKSYVSRIFKEMGYEVYDADSRARNLYTSHAGVQAKVIEAFGADIYTPEGELNRPKLASIVFTDRSKLNLLNSIVHPATREDYLHWKEAILQKGYERSLLFREAAILFEVGAYRGLDGVITVYAPKELRIQRVTQRDQSSRQQVLDRMNKQWPDIKKRQLADFVVYNDGIHDPKEQALAALSFFNPQT